MGVGFAGELARTSVQRSDSTNRNSPRYTSRMIRSVATISFWYFSYPLPAEATARLI